MSTRKIAPESRPAPYFKSSVSEEPFEEGTRNLQPLYPFVISGGKNTERYYFKHISDLTDYKFNIRPRYFGDESRYTEVFPNRIKEILRKNADARIFCVFDWDVIENDKSEGHILLRKHEEFLKEFEEEIRIGKVVICQSMPSIEYWFLLHFEDTALLLKDYSQASSRLAPYMKNCFPNPKIKFSKLIKSEKHLEENIWVRRLIKDDKMKDAIERAENQIRRLEKTGAFSKSSYTYVYKIFLSNPTLQ